MPRTLAFTQRKKDDVSWDVAEGFSLRQCARRNNVSFETVRRWMLEPEFAANVALCRMDIAKAMGDTVVARIAAANDFCLKASLGELPLTDPETAARLAHNDRTVARTIDRLFDDPSVAVGFLRGYSMGRPTLGAPTTGPAGDAPSA